MEIPLYLQLLRAFAVGGGICLIGQLLMDAAKLTPAHSLSLLVCCGSAASLFGWYPALAEYAGCGACLPISSFGNVLTRAALTGVRGSGVIGMLQEMLIPVSVGVSAAVLCGFLTALLFRPRS